MQRPSTQHLVIYTLILWIWSQHHVQFQSQNSLPRVGIEVLQKIAVWKMSFSFFSVRKRGHFLWKWGTNNVGFSVACFWELQSKLPAHSSANEPHFWPTTAPVIPTPHSNHTVLPILLGLSYKSPGYSGARPLEQIPRILSNWGPFSVCHKTRLRLKSFSFSYKPLFPYFPPYSAN